jgi:hypothetical protein
MDPRACLDDMEKWKFFTLPGVELRPVVRPSLYRLSHHGLLGVSILGVSILI